MSIMNLFNGGGSVQSGRGSVNSPREQYISRSNQDRMQDATINRIIQESQGNQQRWEQGGGQGAYPVFNEAGTGANYPMSPGWLQASSQLSDNSGIMTAATDYSPDARGRWLTQSPKGNKLLSFLVNKFGSEGSSEYLEDVLGKGGISAFGGTLSPILEGDRWGLTGTWNL